MGTEADRLLKSSVLGIVITLGLLAVLCACLAKTTTVRAVDSNALQGQVQSLSNPIAINSITIDNDREGWEHAESYSPDPPNDNGGIDNLDWITVTIAHDCSDLYVRYGVNDGASILTEPARYNLLLDMDRNRDTGFYGWGNSFSIGADLLIQGTTVFAFAGGTDQQAWTWDLVQGYHVNDQPLSGSKRDIEYKVSISDLDVFGDGVTGFDWLAWADHTWGTSPIPITDTDFYPDGGYLEGDFNTYTLEYPPPTSLFPNPERGFYRQTNTHDPYGDMSIAAYQPLATHPGTSTLRCWRENYGITLIHRNFWLGEFVASIISQEYLDNVQADLNTVRAAGVKAIIRFAYTPVYSYPTTSALRAYPCDASKEWILTHTQQLSDVLWANSDVIAAMQAGFIGGWGEWYGSCHFPDLPCGCSPDDPAWDDRRDVLFAVLDTLPITRMVQLRTPRYKYNIFSDTVTCSDCMPLVITPLNESLAHTGIPVARTGHHNDCFVSSATDWGTYISPLIEYPYLMGETKYVVMGGETCDHRGAYDPAPDRRRCLTATEELEQFHWSFLNIDWYTDTLQLWRDEGCFPEIEQRLGYRLVLSDVTFPDHVAVGQSYQLSLQIRNEGYAAPYNPRAVRLVLSHTNNFTHAFMLYWPTTPPDQPRDPRFWLAGETHTSDYTVTIPMTLPGGTYGLFLHLPDPELLGRPEYAFRLGDSEWEPSSGYNRLNRSVNVVRRIYLPIVLKIW